MEFLEGLEMLGDAGGERLAEGRKSKVPAATRLGGSQSNDETRERRSSKAAERHGAKKGSLFGCKGAMRTRDPEMISFSDSDINAFGTTHLARVKGDMRDTSPADPLNTSGTPPALEEAAAAANDAGMAGYLFFTKASWFPTVFGYSKKTGDMMGGPPAYYGVDWHDTAGGTGSATGSATWKLSERWSVWIKIRADIIKDLGGTFPKIKNITELSTGVFSDNAKIAANARPAGKSYDEAYYEHRCIQLQEFLNSVVIYLGDKANYEALTEWIRGKDFLKSRCSV